MEIKLLNYTKNGLELIAKFARISGVPKTMTDDEIVKMIVDNDYGSVLEHISFTFLVKDISIALSRELLEHRIASHTAKSTRYVEEEAPNYYRPPVLSGEKLKIFTECVEKCFEVYRKLREMGVKREYARYVLPMATLTTYTWTINARSLINFLTLRGCVRASPEIQELSRKIYDIVVKIYPQIFLKAKCRGTWYGVCPENDARPKNCPYIGKIPLKREIQKD